MAMVSDPAPCGFYSPRQFAAFSGLALATIRRYLAEGRLPFVQPAGPRGRVLIPRDALGTVAPQAVAPVASHAPQSALRPSRAASRPAGPLPRWLRRAHQSQEVAQLHGTQASQRKDRMPILHVAP